MKSINKFLLHSSACLLLMVLSVSCLKDEDFENGKTNISVNTGDKLIEIMGPIIGSYTQVLEFSKKDTTLNLVTVNLAAIEPASEDIKVTLAVDPAVITEYNTRVGQNFTPLPSSAFNFQALEVTIPKGKREAVLKVKVLDPSYLETGKFALGLKVASTSVPGIKISGNYGKQVISLRVKNKYHGDYHSSGYFTHPVASSSRDIDEDKELTTEEPNSVLAPLGDLGGSNYYMLLTINPDNTVTIEPRGTTPNVDQHWGPNFYDPATKSFHLHYSYNPAAPRIIEEVITKK